MNFTPEILRRGSVLSLSGFVLESGGHHEFCARNRAVLPPRFVDGVVPLK